MKISYEGVELIKSFEGFRENAYQDSAGIWTLGYGTIRYANKKPVMQYDHCTKEQAEDFLMHDVAKAESAVNNLLFSDGLTQNQFDALVSFQYNTGALAGSTLYKKAKENPNDETIYNYNPEEPVDSCEFTRWVRAGGKIVAGLVNRRIKEAELYGKTEGGVRPPKPH